MQLVSGISVRVFKGPAELLVILGQCGCGPAVREMSVVVRKRALSLTLTLPQ